MWFAPVSRLASQFPLLRSSVERNPGDKSPDKENKRRKRNIYPFKSWQAATGTTALALRYAKANRDHHRAGLMPMEPHHDHL